MGSKDSKKEQVEKSCDRIGTSRPHLQNYRYSFGGNALAVEPESFSAAL
jgi:hypothetical protein